MAGKKGMTGNGLGGRRENAGRKRASAAGAPMVHINATVTPELMAAAYLIGDGNISVGVRRALSVFALPERSAVAWENVYTGNASPLALHQRYLRECRPTQTLAEWLEQNSQAWGMPTPTVSWEQMAAALLWAAADEQSFSKL